MGSSRYFLLGILLMNILFISSSSAYDNDLMHRMINLEALERSNIGVILEERYGLDKGIYHELKQKKITTLIQDGGFTEDEPGIRSIKHFHDSTEAWSNTTDDAALTWIPGSMSSARWAQGQGRFTIGGDWDWQKARESFYKGFTSTDDSKREKHLAEGFRALGQIMHLVPDMAFPPHVRND